MTVPRLKELRDNQHQRNSGGSGKGSRPPPFGVSPSEQAGCKDAQKTLLENTSSKVMKEIEETVETKDDELTTDDVKNATNAVAADEDNPKFLQKAPDAKDDLA